MLAKFAVRTLMRCSRLGRLTLGFGSACRKDVSAPKVGNCFPGSFICTSALKPVSFYQKDKLAFHKISNHLFWVSLLNVVINLSSATGRWGVHFSHSASAVNPELTREHRDTDDGEILEEIEDDFWDWRMRDAPEFSTSVGESAYNDRLESFDFTVFEDRKLKVQEFLHRLKSVNRNKLIKTEKLDYDIFKDHLQTYLNGDHWSIFQSINPINFLEGINADPGRLQAIMPFSTLGDFENYLQRLIKMPKQIEEKIALLRYAIDHRHVLNNVSVMQVPSQIDSIVRLSYQESPLYKPAFTTKLETSHISSAHRIQLQARAKAAISNINQALTNLKNFLEQKYMPAGRTAWGVSGWPEGRELYQECLKYHTSTDMSPEEVYDLGMQEVSRIRLNMNVALQRIGFHGTITDFYNSIRHDPNFHLNTSDALLRMYKDYIYNRAFPKLPKLFENIPKMPLILEPMPYDGPGGVYISGTPDGKVPGVFLANVRYPEQISTIGIMSLILHETVPGHHLQAIYSLNSDLPLYRALVEDMAYYRMPATFPVNTAYLEGWGMYAEYLGEELGLYTDNYMLMGRYSDEIFRACRLVVDTGLHYFGWEREQAIEYMLRNSAESREGVEREIDRYITWPGQATAYTVGEIKIKQLRQKAENALGDRFNIRTFHSLLLDNGGMPLHLLQRLVDEWIADSSMPSAGTLPFCFRPRTTGTAVVVVPALMVCKTHQLPVGYDIRRP